MGEGEDVMQDAEFEKQTSALAMEAAREHAEAMRAEERDFAFIGAQRLMFDLCKSVTRETTGIRFDFSPIGRQAVESAYRYLVWRGRALGGDDFVFVRDGEVH